MSSARRTRFELLAPARPLLTSGTSMKKATKTGAKRRVKPARKRRASAARATPMRAEYDLSNGVRGKYAKRFAAGSNVVVLEPDVASAYPTAKAVNAALRRTLGAASAKRGAGSKRRTA